MLFSLRNILLGKVVVSSDPISEAGSRSVMTLVYARLESLIEDFASVTQNDLNGLGFDDPNDELPFPRASGDDSLLMTIRDVLQRRSGRIDLGELGLSSGVAAECDTEILGLKGFLNLTRDSIRALTMSGAEKARSCAIFGAGVFLPRLSPDQFEGFLGRSAAALGHHILQHRAHELKRSSQRRSVMIRLSHIMEDSVNFLLDSAVEDLILRDKYIDLTADGDWSTRRLNLSSWIVVISEYWFLYSYDRQIVKHINQLAPLPPSSFKMLSLRPGRLGQVHADDPAAYHHYQAVLHRRSNELPSDQATHLQSLEGPFHYTDEHLEALAHGFQEFVPPGDLALINIDALTLMEIVCAPVATSVAPPKIGSWFRGLIYEMEKCNTEPLSYFSSMLRRAVNDILESQSNGDDACDPLRHFEFLVGTCPDLVRQKTDEARDIVLSVLRITILCDGRERSETLTISRASILQDSIDQLSNYNEWDPDTGKLRIQFVGEQGFDAGGVLRDWATGLAEALSRHKAFRVNDKDELEIQPVQASDIPFYKALGRFLGWIVRHNIQVPLRFPMAYYGIIVDSQVELRDIHERDPVLHKGYQETLKLQANPMEDEIAGKVWTLENRADLIYKQINHIDDSVKPALLALRSEFRRLVPLDKIHTPLTPLDLAALIEGQGVKDVREFKRLTRVYLPQTRTPDYDYTKPVAWLWEILAEAGPERIAKFLQFSTGSSRLPFGGLGSMRPPLTVAVQNIDDSRLPPHIHAATPSISLLILRGKYSIRN